MIRSFLDGALTQIPHTTTEERRRAVRLVGTLATNATDAAELLDALGLAAEDGLRPARMDSGPALREENCRRLHEYLDQAIEAHVRVQAAAAQTCMREVYRNVQL